MSKDIELTTTACFIKKIFGGLDQIEITVFPDGEDLFEKNYDLKISDSILGHSVRINLGGNKLEFTMGEAMDLHKVLGEVLDKVKERLA